MKTFFTSDLHYSHANIIKYCSRPYKDIHHMNISLTNNWNSIVSPEDEVWVLGDVSWNPQQLQNILPRLNGTKYLVSGNHDKCFKSQAQVEKYRWYGFSEVYTDPVKRTFNGREFVLCHFPYTDTRFPHKVPLDEGLFLLHGHSHSRKENVLRENMLDVGVDGHDYHPWELTELLEFIDVKV